MKIAIQSNVWTDERHQQLAGVLDEIAAAGYDGLEIGAHRIDMDATDALRALAGARRLQFMSLHVHGELHAEGWYDGAAAHLDKVAASAAALGAPHMAISGKPKPDKSAEELRRQCEQLNRAGALAQKHGVRLCYHNHFWEIANDCAELRAIIAQTDPALVSLALDVAWVVRGGAPLVETVSMALPRIGYFHIKDTLPDAFTDLGKGMVDFVALFGYLRGRYDRWLVVERDEPLPNALDSARACRDYLKRKFAL